MERSFIHSPIGKIIGLLIFLALLLTWVLWPRRLPAPVESNRVYHPEDGYSIIAPPEYTMTFETAEHTLTDDRGWLKVAPLQPGYFPPSIMVKVRSKAPDVDDLVTKRHFVKGTFHDLPAWMGLTRKPHYYDYNIIFEDRDKWFDIGVETPDYFDVPNSYWWPYIESFKYEPERARQSSAPTTRPINFSTTLPSNVINELSK